jgi:predicted alpha/beta-fold hydrolase
MHYVAPHWLPGGNLQTIWPALWSRRGPGRPPQYRRERWTTPDEDFIDVDFLIGPDNSARVPPTGRGWLVLFHGLEGSSRSHYAEAFAHWAGDHGLQFVVPHFRGCSGELNLGPRAYHSGDFAEIDWILARLSERAAGAPLRVVGVSLGGNALMRWAGETGDGAARRVASIASVSAPLDLAAGGEAIGRGFNRQVYNRMFLQSMKPKALAKLAQHPGLFDRQRLMAARDLYEFDDVFTAPLHGFRNTDDYWSRASSKPVLRHVRVPALVLNARNDPFVPASCLPVAGEVSSSVRLLQPAEGGHVGFPAGRAPGHVRWLPQVVGHWLLNPD